MDNRRPKPAKSRGSLERPNESSRTRDYLKSRSRTKRRDSASQDGEEPTKGVSVMEAVSKLDYAPSHSMPKMSSSSKSKTKPSNSTYTSQGHSPESLMTALGVEDQPAPTITKPSAGRTSRIERPSRVERARERSSSRTRRQTSEEKKQSIREARARSRSRSNTRGSMRAGTYGAEGSVAPSMASLSRSSSITEKTKVSRRPASGSDGGTKRTTQQLILLRHAARCPYGPDSVDRQTRGPCPIHKQCADMKILLSHMTNCVNDVDCPFPNCAKSKGLLEVIYPNQQPPPPPPPASAMPAVRTAGIPQGPPGLPSLSPTAAKAAQPEDALSVTVSSEETPVMTNTPRASPTREGNTPRSPPPQSQPSPDPPTPDIEMAAGNDEALEQQSLLEEIHARRMKRAPKIKHKAPKAPSVSTASSSNSSTAGSSFAASVTSEIKRKAEVLLGRMKRGEEDGIFFGTARTQRWLRIGKFFCMCCGIVVILSIVALILLYVFGGEGWMEDSAEIVEEHGSGFVPVGSHSRPPSSAPVFPMQVQRDGPTMSPTSFSMALPDYTMEAIHQDEEMGFSGEDRSPQSRAYDWILNEQQYLSDKFNPDYGEAVKFEGEQWINRFALATFYYSTTLGKSKLHRSSGTKIHKSSNWTHSKNWLAMGVSECEWSFYGCDGGDSLWITNNGLRGTLPPEMGMLTRVRDMAIMNNPTLAGSLPSQLGLLHHTVSVNFQENKLSGSIPSEIGAMKKLRWLYLNGNKLRDAIPANLAQSSRIAFLWLNDNKLSGSLDPNLFANNGFKYLKELLLHNNQLTGPIPNEIGMMPRVRFISMHENKISGTIPTTLGMLTDLEVLKLHNTALTGSVPEEVCHLVQRGSLTTLTIDCDKVTCNCGCSCTNDDKDELPPMEVATMAVTFTPTAAGAASVTTREPTPKPTTAPSLGARHTAEPSALATTGEPPGLASLELARPPVQPSAAPFTPPPTEAPSPMPVAMVAKSLPPSPFPTHHATPEEKIPPTSFVDETPTAPTTPYLAEYDAFEAVPIAADFMLQLPDFTKESLLDYESPQSMALNWLEAHPNLDQYSFDRKLQRFAMATIFFSTNGTDWAENDKWLDYREHECDWYTTYSNGDVCHTDPESGERVLRDLVQWGNNLIGPLPPEISLLTSLDKIFLGVNNITNIPTEIGLLSDSLRVLNLMHCSIEGPLLSELGELSRLKKMDLSENFFEGLIPSEIGRLKLENLYLNHNMLYGKVPIEVFHLETAKGFNIAANSLTGSLPSDVGRLVHVQWMNLYGNWLEGHIPSEMGLMKKMAALHTSHNLLSGSIPSEIAELRTSHSLSLDFRYNQLTGTVPSELGVLTNLVVLALEGNPDLSGDMPGEICELASDWKLDTLSLDCAAVSCQHEACGVEDVGGVCVCPAEYDYYDDDNADGGGR